MPEATPSRGERTRGGIQKVPRNSFQADALGRRYRQVTRFLQHRRPNQPMERYLLEFDALRRKAKSRVVMGGAFPDAFVSILCMQNAALSRRGKSTSPASVQGSSDFPIAAKQMRRLFDPCGGPARQDVLTATDWGMESDEEDFHYESCAANREAKRRRKVSPRGLRTPCKGANKIKRNATDAIDEQGGAIGVTPVTVNTKSHLRVLSGNRGGQSAYPVSPQ